MHTKISPFFENEPEWLVRYRQDAREKIIKTALPLFRHGLSISIDPMFDFERIVTKQITPHRIIKVNTGNAQVFEGAEVFSSPYTAFLASFFSDEWKDADDENKLYYLNQAGMNDFVLIVLPKNSEQTQSIEINTDIIETPHITTILILAEQQSKGKIVITKKYETDGYCAETIRAIAQQGSTVEIITLEHGTGKSIAIEKRKARVHKNATVNWVDVRLGTEYTKNEIVTSLAEEGASTKNTVLYLARHKQKYDIFTSSRHDAPRTTSDIFTRGVLNDQSKGLSRGLVHIGINAAGSNGYEKQDALLLSDTAEADAIPNLEINNHDVKCSHGSTVGPINPEKMFYLMSKGLGKKDAQQLIVEGYFTPVIETFTDEALKEKVRETIREALA
ncbi:MAG: SufD family Fe-S cluster assembly protein [Candidatus Woesearchaeota archaeon]|nr:SufD family Fe-S cluster assembly protein [Candidatus Woesearchaeota archaeon]